MSCCGVGQIYKLPAALQALAWQRNNSVGRKFVDSLKFKHDSRKQSILQRLSIAMNQTIRVLIAKAGLDGHDRGAKVIAAALRDAGMEVIYTGLRQTPLMIVEAALQEDVDVIGISMLSGAHMTIFPKVRELMNQKGLDDVLLTGGGIMSDVDIAELKVQGVGDLFTPGAPTTAIVDYIRKYTAEHPRS